MTHKILLADDSLTIQKVVKITLADEPYEITDCSNDIDLFTLLKSQHFHLVLLDFGLSQKFNGYILAKKIKEQDSKTKIIMLYGTFDTIDEMSLKDAFVSAKIVKPFESGQFTDLCNSTLSDFADNEIETNMEEIDDIVENSENAKPFPTAKKTIDLDADETFLDDDWIVNSDKKSLEETLSGRATAGQLENNTSQNLTYNDSTDAPHLLKNELEGWGMSIPPKQNIKSQLEISDLEVADLPPIIENFEKGLDKIKGTENSLNLKTEGKSEKPVEPNIYPNVDELAYPEGVNIEASADRLIGKNKNKNINKELDSSLSSKLISIDDLVLDNEPLAQDEQDQNNHVSERTEILNARKNNQDIELEGQIKDEISAEDFWVVDEEVDVIEKQNIKANTLVKQERKNMNKIEGNIYIDELVSDLKMRLDLKVNQMIEEIVKKQSQLAIEKLSWEIIPDLAENLIKEEIKKIMSPGPS